jgi:tetratricopeptide (TPR) repeat protein
MQTDAGFLEGKRVCFTGRLASLTRTQAAALVRKHGGHFCGSLSRGTSILVVGQDGWPLRKDGRVSTKLRQAHLLAQAGQQITVLSEDEWLTKLDMKMADGDRRLFTADELSALLKVAGDRLRKWVSLGLIQSFKTEDGLSYFDFAQVSSARTLVELLRSGITLPRLRRSMQQLQAWLGNADQPLLQLVAMERSGELLMRLEDGLVEPSGQRCFDFFESQAEPAVSLPESQATAEELFERACAFEDAGQLDEAISTYRQALLAGGPDSAICYNLANALYALGHVEAAIERYYQAVELTPDSAESWNNLGIALTDLGRAEEAGKAFERALSINPHYVDVHYNLADLLDDAGDATAARKHWLAYLAKCDQGPRQRYARRRVEGR